MNAILYARFSPRPNAKTCESIEIQFEKIREYCQANNITCDGAFSDRAISGGDGEDREDRPGLWQAIDALKKGDVLIVHKLDRLARSVYLSHLIEKTLKRKRCRLLSVSGEGTWTDTDQDVLIRQILTSLSEFERKTIASRTKIAKIRHQANLRSQSSNPPYGYSIDPANSAMLIENATEQEVIAKIKLMRSENMPFRAISKALDASNIPSRGKHWHFTTIYRLMQRLAVFENAAQARKDAAS